ncbi:hypothetical protein [Azospira restricta]|uniref:Uncharacterized protein n=1 Tax=Azospira restricta TaxID=404405 RepID=A0A974SRL7_9RHOO|nr:hypothetical protein [Azospira restricta]QRJ65243.1 hypothetical protein IWH25_07900 [Azospira restricta]
MPQRRLARQLILVLVLCGVLTALVSVWLLHSANAKYFATRRASTETHFVGVISGLEQQWGREAFSVKTRIESLRYLESRPRQLEALAVHLTSLGRSLEFPLLRIEDAHGGVLARFEYLRREPPKVHFRAGQESAWVFDDKGGHLYLALRVPIWLGAESGYLVLFKPIDHAQLSGYDYPETRLSLWWQGRPVASSEGRDGLAAALAASRRGDDPALIRLPWGGADPIEFPVLMVELTSPSLLGAEALVLPLIVGFVPLAVALFLVFRGRGVAGRSGAGSGER